MTTSITEAAIRKIAKVICSSRTCEGINCCQWPCNGGRHGDWNRFQTTCKVEAGAYDDAALAALGAMREPAEMSIVPIPIRPDVTVKVQLPFDLSAEEAEKVARVILALARIPEQGAK